MQETCKYLDSFGTKYNFFTDGKPKLYTTLGGILTIISILLSLIVFICFNLDDFRRKTPTTLFSSVLSEDHRKVKFKDEKIWIPWRIVDYNNEFVNHTGLIYPIIYYYEGERKSFNNTFIFKEKKISYKLCNETSMINKPEIYYLEVPLDKLNCIDMDDLDMGGSWINLYVNYVKMDFYLCKDGIDYNENSNKCTSYEKIHNIIGNNNSLKIEFYYPEVQFQPTNKKNPMIVLYRQNFYHISKFTNKIDRLFLQQHLLSDDYGWFYTKIKNSSYWGYNSLTGDSYVTPTQKDLINEGSTSRVYSLNIYLEPSIMNYNRTYKKLLLIITQSIPIVYVVVILFRNIAKIFKLAEQKKKIVDLLFENLKEKKRRKFQLKKNPAITNVLSSDAGCAKIKKGDINKKILNNEVIVEEVHESDLKIDKKCNTILNEPSNKNKKIRPSIDGLSVLSNNCSINNMNSRDELKKNLNTVECLNIQKNTIKNKTFGTKNKNTGEVIEENRKIKIKSIEDKFEKMENIANEFYYIKGKLFPYVYYLYSVFTKSIDIKKFKCCFSKKYIKVYTFICQMFDISSYLLLLREFELVKSMNFKDAELDIIERNKKINVNTRKFSRNINECIDKKKFNLFSKNM